MVKSRANVQVRIQHAERAFHLNINSLLELGQTCYIASLAASTNEPYKLQGGRKPTGGNAMGDSCIKSAYKTLGLSAPAGLRLINLIRRSENIEEFYGKLESVNPTLDKDFESEDTSNSLEKRQGSCRENTVLFGRGTTELGSLGSTVGPALSSGLGGAGWSVQGISYSADLSGIYCLGMTGGLKCVQQINALAARCPKTNIVLSGYSQGAMVARICAAWAGDAAKKQIKVIFTQTVSLQYAEANISRVSLFSETHLMVLTSREFLKARLKLGAILATESAKGHSKLVLPIWLTLALPLLKQYHGLKTLSRPEGSSHNYIVAYSRIT
jgi:hypothetical protein